MRRKKNKGFVKKIALERIYRLFELAAKEFNAHPERSNRYVQLAIAISKRNKARIPAELKKQYCKKCHCFLVKGKNSTFTKCNGFIAIKCLQCNALFKKREK